ncbi:MAG: NADH:flavin oxidoreductase [Magnetococcales bacterium]|nr:NADH:flavin oxidoreductase [Magnetococcales bacterium]
MTSRLFERTTINGMVLENRLVRSATWEGMCTPEGRPTPKLSACYQELAQGEVGLIISGYAFVRQDGQQLPGKMGIHTDDFANEMRHLTEVVHASGGRIAMQLVHAGGKANTMGLGTRPLAPSAIRNAQFTDIPDAMTPHDIEAIVTAFAQGARRAKDYGFDAVQLHGAHGYLINQFLSPSTNQRTDGYGGSVENRRRFLMEVYGAVRQAVGNDYPVLIKLNGDDFIEDGLTLEEAVLAAKALDQAGIDAIEVSGGTSASGDRTPARGRAKSSKDEGYHRSLAQRIKEAVQCPIMVVGGFRSREVIEQTLQEGVADYIALARPFIREPNLAAKWHQGQTEAAGCQSCNGCFKPGLEEGGIYCVKLQNHS